MSLHLRSTRHRAVSGHCRALDAVGRRALCEPWAFTRRCKSKEDPVIVREYTWLSRLSPHATRRRQRRYNRLVVIMVKYKKLLEGWIG